MERPAPVTELLEAFGRCRSAFNALDLSVLAHRDVHGAFSILSLRLTLGWHRGTLSPPVALMRRDWFVMRQWRRADDFYELLDRLVAGRDFARLFNKQPAEHLRFSQVPRGWYMNGTRRSDDSVFGADGVAMRVGCSWAPLFSSGEAFRAWENEVNASDDVPRVHGLVASYALRQPCSQADHARQAHVELEFPIYSPNLEAVKGGTQVSFKSEAEDFADWKFKWRTRASSGIGALEAIGANRYAMTVAGEHASVDVTPVCNGFALPEIRVMAGSKATAERGHTSAVASVTSKASPRCDVAVLTIRPDELEAALGVYQSDPELYVGPKSSRHYNMRSTDAGRGGRYRVAIVRHIEQGNGEAQNAAHDIIEELQPRLLLVVGIAGGRPTTDFTLGDVVVSTRVNDYTVRSENPDGPTFAVSGGPVERAIAASVANLTARRSDLGDWFSSLPPRPALRPGSKIVGPRQWTSLIRRSLDHHFARSPPSVPT